MYVHTRENSEVPSSVPRPWLKVGFRTGSPLTSKKWTTLCITKKRDNIPGMMLKTIRPKVWDRTPGIGMGQLVSHQPSPCQMPADGGKTAQITGRAKSLGSGALSVARLMRAAVGGKKFLLKVSRELSGVVTHLGDKPSSRPRRSAILRIAVTQVTIRGPIGSRELHSLLCLVYDTASVASYVVYVSFFSQLQHTSVCRECNLSSQ